MNHIIGNEQFTVLKNTTYRRHIIQAVSTRRDCCGGNLWGGKLAQQAHRATRL